MPDPFSIRRKFDEELEDLTEDLKARRKESAEVDRERLKRLVPLKGGYYFDPQTREILRKVGAHFVYMRHDRRRTSRDAATAGTVRLKPIQGGLYWDSEALAVYNFNSGHYVLYSRDRRKVAGKSPVGKERRKA